ncbi:MAG: efflux RND transporter periplasmic adaptor subunit [Syntrophales bacterium]|nr:efflux RND transporter periplasmic adaptor subunit [Syntrophales bacterium]MDD5641307.1 efflux RND transporter periplasmic adaptor subunit [Syntrophales bacterium]
MMRVSRRKNWWLVIMVVVLGVAGYWGWRHLHEDQDHDHHEPRHQEAQGEKHQPSQDHDHETHDDQARREHHDEQKSPQNGEVKLTQKAAQQAKIATAPVVRGPLDNRVLFTGELVFNEERLAKIRARVPGRVVQIVADYGQTVKPGEVLALIDSVELGQARMAARQAAARFNAAQKAYDRARQLYEGKAISRAELQERQARLEVERADLDYAQNRLRLLGAKGAAPSWPQRSQAGAKTAIPSASGAVFALRSPIAGRVVDRKVTPGLVVKEEAELFTVTDTSALWCFVQIPEKDLPLVKVGSQAVITINSLPRKEFSGRLDYLADMVDKATRTIKGRVRVDNPHNLLKAGMFANIAIQVGRRTALSVPETAVLNANGDLFVFVEMAPGVYRKHPIKIGEKAGGRVEVLAGLEAGEPVVVQGGFILKSELVKGGSRGGLGHGHAH